MRRLAAFALLIAGAAVAPAACSGSDSATPDKLCDPGVDTFCRCGDNSAGLHTCKKDGQGFGKCRSQDGGECPDRPAGGSCGDGVQDPGEECDDGDFDDSNACTSLCVPARCGDGFVQSGVEECDDGNTVDDDACTNACKAGSGCGNGTVDGNEQCDDGNTANNDACVEGCLDAKCGDGFLENGVEDCDDGNTDDGDSCNHDCTIPVNANYGCPGAAITVDATLPVTVSGDTSQSKNTYMGSCGGGQANDVVHAVTTLQAGVLNVKMQGLNGSDPVLYAASTDCATGPELGCSDSTFSGGTETLTFAVQAGATYWIFADGYDGTSGAYQMTFTLTTSVSGDACPGNAISVSPNSNVTQTGDTSIASSSGGQSYKGTGACGVGASTKDIVYAVTPTQDGALYTFVTPAPGFDAIVYARSGSCTTGTQLDCSDGGGPGVDEGVAIQAVAGTKYSIFVDGKNGSAGAYTVTFELQP